jgi:glutamate racemase
MRLRPSGNATVGRDISGTDASRSVAPPWGVGPPPAVTAFDHLLAALAPRNGWVQSPGSVEHAAARLDAAKEVVLAVSVRGQGPSEAAESVASALLLGRLCKQACKSVSFLVDPNLSPKVADAVQREGFDVVKPDALTERGSRLVLSFEAGAAAHANARRHESSEAVTLGRYPRVADVLADAQSFSSEKNDTDAGRSRNTRVSAPTAGAAGLAVAVKFASGRGLYVPTPKEFVHSVGAIRVLLARPEGAEGGGRRPAERSTEHVALEQYMYARAELIRAVGQSEAGPNAKAKQTPYLVAAFDSSNGGIIAARNSVDAMRSALREKGIDRDVRFLIVADHDNAPYGNKKPEPLRLLVTAGLTASALFRPDAIMMACNTACTALPDAERAMRLSEHDVPMPVIHLIDVTVDAIVEHGGPRPAVLSTVATYESTAYQSRLENAGCRDHVALGCDGWADIVNAGSHTSEEPLVKDSVRKSVAERIEDLRREAPDLSSVWLCCTHFPALKPHIEAELALQFPGREIPVIDPMEYQARATAAALAEQGAPREARGESPTFAVLTTATADAVRPTSTAILGASPFALSSARSESFEQGAVLPQSVEASLASTRRSTLGLPASSRDALLSAYVLRGVDAFAMAGGPKALASSLAKAQNVVLLTGFSVAQGKPETDGPPGTAVLAKSLLACGKTVTVVTDRGNADVMREAFATIAARGGPSLKFEVFEATGPNAAGHASQLLERLKADAVVAIELPGRNAEGRYLNMRGVDIGGFNAPVDALLLEANRKKLFTAGIGDGGNEAGVGHLEGIPAGRFEGHSFDFKTVVTSGQGVTAWNSNFGAIATAMELAHLTGTKEAMPSSADVERSIRGAVAAGAVDGVTREPSVSVDGFSHRVHVMFADLYRERLSGRTP